MQELMDEYWSLEIMVPEVSGDYENTSEYLE